MAKKRSVAGIVVTVILLLILAIVIGIAACAFMITATPNLEQFETAETYSFDAQAFTMMMGGEMTLKPAEINCLLKDSVEDSGEDFALVSVKVDTDDAEDELWVCVQLRAFKHIWTIRLLTEAEVQITDGMLQTVVIKPQKLQIGRLTLPQFMWRPLLDKFLPQTKLDYENGRLTVPIPQTQLPVKLDTVTIRPEGIVAKVQPMLQLPGGDDQAVGATPLPEDEKKQALWDKAQKIFSESQNKLLSGEISMEDVVEKMQDEIGKTELSELIDRFLPKDASAEDLLAQVPSELLQNIPGIKDKVEDWLIVLKNAAVKQ